MFWGTQCWCCFCDWQGLRVGIFCVYVTQLLGAWSTWNSPLIGRGQGFHWEVLIYFLVSWSWFDNHELSSKDTNSVPVATLKAFRWQFKLVVRTLTWVGPCSIEGQTHPSHYQNPVFFCMCPRCPHLLFTVSSLQLVKIALPLPAPPQNHHG